MKNNTNITKIRKGDFVTITLNIQHERMRENPVIGPYDTPLDVYIPLADYTGYPAIVLAQPQPPFIPVEFIAPLVEDFKQEPTSLDVRVFNLRKVPKDYVRAFAPKGYTTLTGETISFNTVENELLKGRCPECGRRMKKDRYTPVSAFFYVCNSCNLKTHKVEDKNVSH